MLRNIDLYPEYFYSGKSWCCCSIHILSSSLSGMYNLFLIYNFSLYTLKSSIDNFTFFIILLSSFRKLIIFAFIIACTSSSLFYARAICFFKQLAFVLSKDSEFCVSASKEIRLIFLILLSIYIFAKITLTPFSQIIQIIFYVHYSLIFNINIAFFIYASICDTQHYLFDFIIKLITLKKRLKLVLLFCIFYFFEYILRLLC